MRITKKQLQEMIRQVIREQMDSDSGDSDSGSDSDSDSGSDNIEECGSGMGREPRRLSVLFSDDEDRELGEASMFENAGSMDDFCAAYIEAALWSTTDESDESGGQPLDENYSVDDIEEETLKKMQFDCDKFQELAGDMIIGKEESAGHDFWLTRNGHGAGFWDGDWPEHGDALTKLSKKFGEVWLVVTDDGTIEQM